ncbi:unnamed protein product [Rotaria sp. Silwood2]|nr:unnamed protein product [Rotaria sp. Silwood2]
MEYNIGSRSDILDLEFFKTGKDINGQWIFITFFIYLGRLDYQYYIPLPNEESRLVILKTGLCKISLTEDINLKYLVEKTDNLTGAIINGICREVKQLAAREFIERRGTANLIPEPQIRRGHFDLIINTAPRLISNAEIKEFETYLMRLHQLKYYK